MVNKTVLTEKMLVDAMDRLCHQGAGLALEEVFVSEHAYKGLMKMMVSDAFRRTMEKLLGTR